jgi:hypothetical protein
VIKGGGNLLRILKCGEEAVSGPMLLSPDPPLSIIIRYSDVGRAITPLGRHLSSRGEEGGVWVGTRENDEVKVKGSTDSAVWCHDGVWFSVRPRRRRKAIFVETRGRMVGREGGNTAEVG